MKTIALAILQLCAVTDQPDDCEWYMLECINIEKAECFYCSDDAITEVCIESYVEPGWSKDDYQKD